MKFECPINFLAVLANFPGLREHRCLAGLRGGAMANFLKIVSGVYLLLVWVGFVATVVFSAGARRLQRAVGVVDRPWRIDPCCSPVRIRSDRRRRSEHAQQFASPERSPKGDAQLL